MHLPANPPFRLEADWLNAQAFRWKQEGEWLYGIVGGHLIRVREDGDGIEFEGDATEEAVRSYFRLNEDIAAVHDALRKADPKHMPGLINDYGCIRVLRQDPWECLVAYICSARARIEGIRGKLDRLAKEFGITRTLDGVEYRALPSAQRLADAAPADLEKLKLGLLHIPETIREVAADVHTCELDLPKLSQSCVPHAEARKRLRNDRKGNGYHGIGDKIADCVCLFSLGKDEAFPVDRHIGAALERRYGLGGTLASKREWACETFGPNAGYAGQMLFLDQLVENRRQQVRDRYASEDSTIVIDEKRLYPQAGVHSHDFPDGASLEHAHAGGDEQHTHRKEDVFDAWMLGERD